MGTSQFHIYVLHKSPSLCTGLCLSLCTKVVPVNQLRKAKKEQGKSNRPDQPTKMKQSSIISNKPSSLVNLPRAIIIANLILLFLLCRCHCLIKNRLIKHGLFWNIRYILPEPIKKRYHCTLPNVGQWSMW
jgi:hypothetical protein